MKFKAHSHKQEQAIFSRSPITVLGTGIQFGKTTAGAWWLRRMIHEFNSPDDAFLVLSPTYKILQQSTLPPLLKVLEGWGEYNISRSEFKIYKGGTIYLRTNTEPDSIVGITNVRAIWGDEAGKFTLYFWENIQGRSSFKQCPIILTTSPYTINWIYKDLIKPTQRGLRNDVTVIQASSDENPHFPRGELEKKKQTMDSRRFNMMYGGQWDRMQGLVYDCWDDEYNIIKPFQLPMGTRFVVGIDWGYTDPFVMSLRAITPDGRHYGISEFYKTQTTIQDQIMAAKHMQKVWGVREFFADPSQPGSIEEFNRNGIPTIPAENDIRKGIDMHYDLIKTRRYKEFEGACPHAQDEREQYHYPEPDDLKPDQDHKEAVPVGQFDHVMDTHRYITAMTYHNIKKQTPIIKSEEKKKLHEMDQYDRYDYLTKSWKRKKTHEEWS